jgi:16S rRNA processing protein RimM
LTRAPRKSLTDRAAAAENRVSLTAGRVGRPHGLDGSFYVTRPRPRLLALGAAVTVAGHAARIVRRAGTEQRPIVRIEGVEDRPAVQRLRGAELTVDDAQAPALAPDEWWAHELEGCAVSDRDAIVGTVVRLVELPSCEALQVRMCDGGEDLLVPMVKDAIRAVAPAERRIDVDIEFLDLGARRRKPARGQGERRFGGSAEGRPEAGESDS